MLYISVMTKTVSSLSHVDVESFVVAKAAKFLDAVSANFHETRTANAIVGFFCLVQPPLPESFYDEILDGFSVEFEFKFSDGSAKYFVTYKFRDIENFTATLTERTAREVVAELAFGKYLNR